MPKPSIKLSSAGVLRELKRRIALASEKVRNENLSYAAGSMAEAYEIGVQEAQRELVSRMSALVEAATPQEGASDA